MQWSAAWSVSPVNNPHSHLKQKVGLIEPSSRAKNAKMFESCRYDSFPNFTGGSPTSQSIFAMASVVALNGISRHCLAQMHLACSHQCRSKIFQSPTIRNQNYIIQKGKMIQLKFQKWKLLYCIRLKLQKEKKKSTSASRTFSSCWPMRVLWGMGPRQAFGKSLLDNPNHIPGFSFQTLWSWKSFHVKFLD